MQVSAKWDGDVRFKATTGTGFEVMMDGEQKQGARPMEMMLITEIQKPLLGNLYQK